MVKLLSRKLSRDLELIKIALSKRLTVNDWNKHVIPKCKCPRVRYSNCSFTPRCPWTLGRQRL